MVEEHTPYSNCWQVKIHDLCKVSCICSSYAFGFKWTSKHVEVMQRYEYISLCISHHFERWFALKNIFLLSQKNNRLFSRNNWLFYLWHIWIKLLSILMHNYSCFFSFKTHYGSNICILGASELDSKGIYSLFSLKFKAFYVGNHIAGHGLMNICICDYIWSLHLAWVYYVVCLRDIGLCVLEELPKDKCFCYNLLQLNIRGCTKCSSCRRKHYTSSLDKTIFCWWFKIFGGTWLGMCFYRSWLACVNIKLWGWHMLCGECDLDCETNLKIIFFLSTPLLVTVGCRKDRGRNCGLLVEFFGSMVL